MKKNDNITVVSSQVIRQREALTNYWTIETMKNAAPIETKFEDPLVTNEMDEPWEQEGIQTILEPKFPLNTDLTELPLLESIEENAAFSTKKVANRSSIPYSAVGKMFMTFDGKDYVGTGWVIANKAVFTAGHCVYDRSNGGWADNILFVPQYDDGQMPIGSWTALQIHSLKGWTENRDFKYDLATFVVNQPIRDKTGSIGWMANYPPNQGRYNSIGYPSRPISNFDFDGQNMWHSTGNYIGGRNPIQMQNNMAPGCSGGPWVIKRNNMAYANGLNSFRYTNEPNKMYSPYFGEGFLNLYNTVKNAR